MEPDDRECVICPHPHPRCTGHVRDKDPETGQRSGPFRPCMRQPNKSGGVFVCRHHGGALANVQEAGRRRVEAQAARADAEAWLVSTGEEGVPDLPAAMESLAAMAMSMVRGYAMRVNALTDLTYSSEFGVEQIRGELVLLDKAITQAGKLLELTAKHQPDGEAAAAVNLLTSLSDQIKGAVEQP